MPPCLETISGKGFQDSHAGMYSFQWVTTLGLSVPYTPAFGSMILSIENCGAINP